MFENLDVNCSKYPLKQGTEEKTAFTTPIPGNENILVLVYLLAHVFIFMFPLYKKNNGMMFHG